jgi:hypothetical protein
MEKQVKAAVETWVSRVTADAKPEAVIDRMEPQVVNGEIVSYVAHLAGGGFCLCGSDDLVLPVYLYSPKGTYDPNVSDLRSVLEEIAARRLGMRALEKQAGVTPASSQVILAGRFAYWQELIAGHAPVTMGRKDLVGPTLLELPLTSLWHQSSPYNDQCPMLVPGQDPQRTLVGCVPTAAAQIMNYWKWPGSGIGSVTGTPYPRKYSAVWVETPLATNPNIPVNWHSEYNQGPILDWTALNGGKLRMQGYWDSSVADTAMSISSDPAFQTAVWLLFNTMMSDVAQPLAANLEAETYNWAIMKDDNSDPPDAAAAEVAKLVFDLGVAIQVRYGRETTTGGWLTPALKTNFQYDPDGLGESRDADKITEDLQWYRPVALRNATHCWVAYGYNMATDPNRQFLMNMGWGSGSGYSHVWLTLDSIPAPANQPVVQQERGIAPAGVVRFVGGGPVSGTGSPANPYPDLAAALGSVPDGTTLIFRAGSLNVASARPLTINRPLTLKGYQATITTP